MYLLFSCFLFLFFKKACSLVYFAHIIREKDILNYSFKVTLCEYICLYLSFKLWMKLHLLLCFVLLYRVAVFLAIF